MNGIVQVTLHHHHSEHNMTWRKQCIGSQFACGLCARLDIWWSWPTTQHDATFKKNPTLDQNTNKHWKTISSQADPYESTWNTATPKYSQPSSPHVCSINWTIQVATQLGIGLKLPPLLPQPHLWDNAIQRQVDITEILSFKWHFIPMTCNTKRHTTAWRKHCTCSLFILGIVDSWPWLFGSVSATCICTNSILQVHVPASHNAEV